MMKVIQRTKKIVEERGYGLYDDEAEGLVSIVDSPPIQSTLKMKFKIG